MGIERSSPPSPAKAAASGEGHHVKGKPSAPGQADASQAGGGGFLSVLLALGDDSGAAGVAVAQDASLVAQEVTDKVLLKPDALPDVPLDPAILLGDLLQALHQTMELPDVPLDPALLLAQSGQLSQAEMPAADPMPSLATSVPQDLAKQDFRASVPSLAPSEPESTQLAIQQMLTKEMAKAVRPNKAALPTGGAGSSLQAAAGSAAADPKFLKSSFAEGLRAAHPALPAILATAEAGESGIRPLERQAEKFAVKQTGGGEGTWGHQALFAGLHVETAAAASDAAMPSPELMVAEQVKYWISNNVQNAEITLDDLGQSPVEVSISLHGLEARVEFRTDQTEVRQILEGAASHLKELLRNEGMVLSGVFVGSSGPDGRQGSQERKPRPQNVQQASVVVPDPVAVSGGLRPGQMSGRAVDLFV